MGPSRERTYGEIADYLARLGRDDLVLVGGQAIGFWVERYIDRVPELEAGAPYASKDIDLRGSREDVEGYAAFLRRFVTFISTRNPAPASMFTNVSMLKS